VGFIIPLPLSGEFAHSLHGFIPAFRTGLRLALLFLHFLFASHCYNIPHKRHKVKRQCDTQGIKLFTVRCDNVSRGPPVKPKSLTISDLPAYPVLYPMARVQAVKVLKDNPRNGNACDNIIMVFFHNFFPIIFNSRPLTSQGIRWPRAKRHRRVCHSRPLRSYRSTRSRARPRIAREPPCGWLALAHWPKWLGPYPR